MNGNLWLALIFVAAFSACSSDKENEDLETNESTMNSRIINTPGFRSCLKNLRDTGVWDPERPLQLSHPEGELLLFGLGADTGNPIKISWQDYRTLCQENGTPVDDLAF